MEGWLNSIALFQILAHSDIYRQFCIGFWGIWYNINLVWSANIRANIVDLNDILDIDGRYWRYWF